MIRLIASLVTLVSLSFTLGACTVESTRELGPDGLPVPKAKKISRFQAKRIPGRMLEAVNTVRVAQGLPPLTLSPALSEAAFAHARDIAAQQRPWTFGSDGSNPPQRAARAGYGGRHVAELVAETFEHDDAIIAAWLTDEHSRKLLLSPEAGEMGVGWYQEPNRKIWWVLELGNPDTPPRVPLPVPPPPAEDTRDGAPVETS